MEALALLILATLFCLMFGSLIICVYWYYRPNSKDRLSSKSEKLVFAIIIMAILSIGIIIINGIEPLLGFIPENWVGHDEDGEIVTARECIALPIGTVAAIFLAYVFAQVEKLRDENRDMKTTLKITKEVFSFFRESQLKEIVNEYNQRLEAISHLNYINQTSTDLANV